MDSNNRKRSPIHGDNMKTLILIAVLFSTGCSNEIKILNCERDVRKDWGVSKLDTMHSSFYETYAYYAYMRDLSECKEIHASILKKLKTFLKPRRFRNTAK